MKSEKNTNIKKNKHIYLLSIVILALAGTIFSINKLRPIPTYTIYKIQANGDKEKVKTSNSLNVAKKEIYKYSEPKNKINASIENEHGERIAIAYGIVNLKQKNHGNITYYDEHLDKMQTLNPAYGADALFQDVRSVNGVLQVQFQISTSVGLVNLSDIQILNIFDSKEVNSYSHYLVNDGYLYHNISGDITDKNYIANIKLGKAPIKLKEGIYYSWDGANFYKELESLVKAKTEQKKIKKGYVSYMMPYIFQDINKNTRYTITDLDSFIAKSLNKDSVLQNSAQYFFDAQAKYNINALTLFSIACLESDYGMNDQAKSNNILFQAQSKNDHSTIENSIEDYAKNLNDIYLKNTSLNFNGNYLGNKAEGINYAYLDDSYWGEKVSSIYASIDGQMGLKDKSIQLSKLKEKN